MEKERPECSSQTGENVMWRTILTLQLPNVAKNFM
jgi:hypothetical protein